MERLEKTFEDRFCDENGCEGGLKFPLLPYDAKTPYMINSEHYLARLVVEYFYRDLKHVKIKQTPSLSEFRQKCWICRSRGFVRNTAWKVSVTQRKVLN